MSPSRAGDSHSDDPTLELAACLLAFVRVERKHVLVVEDDDDASIIYESTLLHVGYDVTCVKTLAAAAAAAARRRPDIVTLDCRLPDGNGLDLLHRWKTSDAMATVPVVVMTAYSEREHVDAATVAGADAFVVKPCSGDALTSFLERVLSAHRPTRKFHRFRMSTRMAAPPVMIPCGTPVQPATVHRIDARRYQVRCDSCMRSSPVVEGEIRDALRRVVELGWVAGGTDGWACPICRGRTDARVRGVRRKAAPIARTD